VLLGGVDTALARAYADAMSTQTATLEVIRVHPRESPMGRLYAELTLSNFNDPGKTMTVTALVDTGADYVTLPAAWRDKLGDIEQTEVLAKMADGSAQRAWLGAPVRIQVGDFRSTNTEVLFLEMEPNAQGEYEPLIGHIALEQSGAALDMPNLRLVRVPYIYVK